MYPFFRVYTRYFPDISYDAIITYSRMKLNDTLKNPRFELQFLVMRESCGMWFSSDQSRLLEMHFCMGSPMDPYELIQIMFFINQGDFYWSQHFKAILVTFRLQPQMMERLVPTYA